MNPSLVARLAVKNASRQRHQGRFVMIGTLVGTAVMCASLALGSSVRASVRHSTVTELGPVDELVVSSPTAGPSVRAAVAGVRLPVRATVDLVAVEATAVTKAFVPRVAPVQIIEVQFSAAASLGPSIGLRGPEPGPGQALFSAQLAREVSAEPGDHVTLYAGGVPTTVEVTRILPTTGLAGLPRVGTDGSTPALDLFVAPGTVGDATGAPAVAALAVANQDGGNASATVTAGLHRALRGLPASVMPIRAEVLAAAASGARHLDGFLEAFSWVGAAAGLLLVALAMAVLVDERRNQLGVLHRLGLRRGSIIASLVTEAAVYSAVGAALGAAVGLGMSELLVVLAKGPFAGGGLGQEVQLTWSAPPAVWVAAWAIGVVGSLVAAAVAAVVSLRRVRFPRRGRGPALGMAVAVTTGVALALAARLRHPAPGVVVAEGVVLSGAVVVALMALQRPLTSAVASLGQGRSLSMRLGLVSPGVTRLRGGLVVAVAAFAVFGLAFDATVAAAYQSDHRVLTRQLGGGSAVVVASDPTRPVPPADVAAIPGVTDVVPTSVATVTANGQTAQLVGFESRFVQSGPPPLVQRSPAFASDADTYRSVASDPGTIIVGSDLGSGLDAGATRGQPHVGEVVVVGDPDTGRALSLVIAGVTASARWAGTDHLFVGAPVAHALGAPEAANLLFVAVGGGTDPDVVAAITNGTHLANGTESESFGALAASRLAAEQALLRLAEAAVALGLVAAFVALVNVLARAVAERRREIGVLRALAMSRGAIGRVFAVEATWLGLQGAVAGVSSGVLLAWLLGESGALEVRAEPLTGWPRLLAVLAVVMAGSVLASVRPARRAAHLDPAVAMRQGDD
jgi:putative ABC transport system permease protein